MSAFYFFLLGLAIGATLSFAFWLIEVADNWHAGRSAKKRAQADLHERASDVVDPWWIREGVERPGGES